MLPRFLALVQVDLVALENLEGSLGGGGDAPGAKPVAAAPPDAHAVLRLKHARPPGGGPRPPLSERLRTRDSAVARAPPRSAAVGGGASWGVGAAFRFALPDEVLPPEAADEPPADRARSSTDLASPRRGRGAPGAPRLPTRGPPQVVHVCVYQRVSSPLAALGLAPNESYLGDVEVPLSALTDDEPLVQWLPLRSPGGSGASWFVRIRISLRFLLVAMAQDPDAKRPPPQQTPEPRTQRLTSSFSDLGDAISDAASEA